MQGLKALPRSLPRILSVSFRVPVVATRETHLLESASRVGLSGAGLLCENPISVDATQGNHPHVTNVGDP